MIVTVFRSRLRPDAAVNGYDDTSDYLEAKAKAMPGFVSIKTFAAEDGERVSIVEFDSIENHDAWRSDADHVRGQQLGRSSYYSAYDVSVCERIRHSTFPA